MSSIQKFFPQGEFTPVGCDEALDGAVLALKVLATGRSSGLTKAECQTLYEQVWHITQCAMTDKAERQALVDTKQQLAEIAREYEDASPKNFEKRLPIYADALKAKVKRMFGVEFSVISAKGKRTEVVRFRSIILSATIDSGIGSLTEIGRLLRRDHSTIIYSRDNLHHQFMAKDEEYRNHYHELCKWWNAVKVERVGSEV